MKGSVSVFCFDREKGTIARRATLSTLPAEFAKNNACADLELTPDGRFVLWLPFRTDCGKYSLDGNALAMKVRPHGRLTGELVESGRLLLYAPDGTSEEFRPLAR